MDELESIISGCQKNSRMSQKILYDRYFESLYVHCQKYRLNDQDIITMINATMLKVFQNIESIKSLDTLDSWIHTIHKNNILNHFRTVTRERSRMIYNTDTVDYWGIQNGDASQHVDMDHIQQAIESLPDQTREVLELYAIQGYKHKEIARKLEMSESNSKYHLVKAREMMAEKLRRNHG